MKKLFKLIFFSQLWLLSTTTLLAQASTYMFYGSIEWNVNDKTFRMTQPKGYRGVDDIKDMEDRGSGASNLAHFNRISNPEGKPSLLGIGPLSYSVPKQGTRDEPHLFILGIDEKNLVRLNLGTIGILKEGAKYKLEGNMMVTAEAGLGNILGLGCKGELIITHFSGKRVVGHFTAVGTAIDYAMSETKYTVKGSFDCGVESLLTAPNNYIFGKANVADTKYATKKLADSKMAFKFLDIEKPDSLNLLKGLLNAEHIQIEPAKIIYPVLFYESKLYLRKEGESLEIFIENFLKKVKK